jgi:hypothetical protein
VAKQKELGHKLYLTSLVSQPARHVLNGELMIASAPPVIVIEPPAASPRPYIYTQFPQYLLDDLLPDKEAVSATAIAAMQEAKETGRAPLEVCNSTCGSCF